MTRGLGRYFTHDIAIDLGTANTLISLAGRGLVVNEPSVVSINRKSKRIVAIGEPARAMLGKTPPQIQAARPLIDGVVSDFEVTEQMLRHYIDMLHTRFRVLWPRPRIIIGLPAGVTEVEQRAVEEAARSAGARRIYLIEEPMAAAIGTGLPVLDTQASMVVDIGGGTTEVAIISGGAVAVFRSLRVAGDELTEAVIEFLRDEHSLAIGEQTAERIKTDIGAVFKHTDPKSMTVRGRNVVTGLPQAVEISSSALRLALARQTRPIVDTIKTVLEEASPELVSDVMMRGVVLSGGGALIAGLERLVERDAKMHVIVAENAMTAVVEGAQRVLGDLEHYRPTLLSVARG